MPRLPPVPISPQARLRARLSPGVGNSVLTCDQPHSSSSATSCASPVSVPCPISERAMRITHVSSDLITTQALTSVPLDAAADPAAVAEPVSNPSGSPSARPPPATAAEPTMNLRRERFGAFDAFFFMVGLRLSSLLGGQFGRQVHGSANPLIRAAATDVGHRRIDVGIARIGLLLEQRRRGHELTRLAVAALRHVDLGPGAL